MAVTTFRSEVRQGPIDNLGITYSFVASDASIALWAPVVLSDASITDLPHVASTTTPGNKAVIGICVKRPRSNSITADVSLVAVLVFGFGKLRVKDANVSMNAVLETSDTADRAQVQAAQSIRSDVLANTAADTIAAFENIRAGFAIALTQVSNGAGSVIAVFVNIVPCSGAVAA